MVFRSAIDVFETASRKPTYNLYYEYTSNLVLDIFKQYMHPGQL